MIRKFQIHPWVKTLRGRTLQSHKMCQKFKVIMDHKPLAKMNLRARTNEELGDVSNYLLKFNMNIECGFRNYKREARCQSSHIPSSLYRVPGTWNNFERSSHRLCDLKNCQFHPLYRL